MSASTLAGTGAIASKAREPAPALPGAAAAGDASVSASPAAAPAPRRLRRLSAVAATSGK